MKVVCFQVDGKEYYGILDGEKVQAMNFSSKVESSIFHIDDNSDSLDLKKLNSIKESAIYKLSDVKLLAPVLSPSKIICLGLNYYDHAAEQNFKKIPDEPLIFMKPRTTIIGPNMPIIKPSFVKQLDYEAELAIIIGKKGKNIMIEKAREYIFGYTILNDVSARDIQQKDRQWTRSKSFDTFAPIGPCITTADQIKAPQNLKVKTWINGELRQDSSTKNMVFNVYEIIHHISRGLTLEPLDIIATGTPAGVGVFMKPEPKFLKSHDRIIIEIEEIGKLENYVIEAE